MTGNKQIFFFNPCLRSTRTHCYIYLFTYFGLFWVSVAVSKLSLVAVSRGCSALWGTGFSLRWLLLLQSTGSRHMGSLVVAHRL